MMYSTLYSQTTTQDTITQHKSRNSTLYKYYVSTEAIGWITGTNLNFEINVRRKNFLADYLRFWMYVYKDLDGINAHSNLNGKYGYVFSCFYSITQNKRKLNYELGLAPHLEYGDPIARVHLANNYGSSKFSPGLFLCLGLRYCFEKIPIQLRLSYLPAYKFDSKEFYPVFGSFSVGYGFKKLSPKYENKYYQEYSDNSNANIHHVSSIKDSTKLFDYYLDFNFPTNRNSYAWSLGLERIKPLSKSLKWNYSSLIKFSGGRPNIFYKENYYNPKYLSVCFQPFHLLYGKSLQLETGISASVNLYRYKGKPYPKEDDSTAAANFYRDVVRLFYMAGLRYTFKKPQISIKLLVGTQRTFFLHDVPYRRNSPPIVGELGINYRLRKKVAR